MSRAQNWIEPAMAATWKKVSMAEELLASVSGFGYKQMVPFINERDAISLDTFKNNQVG